MIKISGIRMPVDAPAASAIDRARKKLRIPQSMLAHGEISKVSVDARRREVMLVYEVTLFLNNVQDEAQFALNAPGVRAVAQNELDFPKGARALAKRPVVCGLGPAGLFAALSLAQQGFRPIVLERGAPMDERVKSVEAFNAGGALSRDANIQFGEGGAGTFSDGKLTTRIGSPLCAHVTETFLRHGAPKEIAYMAHPHIGTDQLRGVIVSLREEIISLGGEVRFNTQLTGVTIKNGALTSVQTPQGEIETELLVLALGHSARDSVRMLSEAGLPFEAKGFAVGMRVEHLQSAVDDALYHGAAGHPALPKGEYHLATKVGQRGVYTFCMCPGGTVVAAASEEGGVVVNGMSNHARDGENANSAVVCTVSPDEFGGSPERAMEFQAQLEQAAFAAGGGGYLAPASTVKAFLESAGSLAGANVTPSYPRGVKEANLAMLLPPPITKALQGALPVFAGKMHAFANGGAVLTGLETRTSSSVRMLRDERGVCTGATGVYPCGEGAGYAGGIMSAAVDGLQTALNIMGEYCPSYT